jgi:hypothetical protein
MSTTVQQLRGLLPGPPVALAVMEAVVAECGCRVLIGYRMDNEEPAAGCQSCDAYGHDWAMGNFNESLRISLVADPQERPLSEVCVELLDQALAGLGAEA